MSDTLMFYQREGERKPPVAQCAVVWSFFRMMSPVVFSEVYGLAEVFPALGALVRLLSGVNAQMDPKLRLLMKSLSTVTALMRLVFITRLLLSCKRLLDAWEETITQCVILYFEISGIWYSGWTYGKVLVIIRLTLYSRVVRGLRWRRWSSPSLLLLALRNVFISCIALNIIYTFQRVRVTIVGL